jgi:hypothetical protein
LVAAVADENWDDRFAPTGVCPGYRGHGINVYAGVGHRRAIPRLSHHPAFESSAAGGIIYVLDERRAEGLTFHVQSKCGSNDNCLQDWRQKNNSTED